MERDIYGSRRFSNTDTISLVRQRLHNRRLFKVFGRKTRRRPALVVRELDGGAVGEDKLHRVQTPTPTAHVSGVKPKSCRWH
jgi:hypothetical protein